MSRFHLSTTALPGLIVIERQPISDHRGFFCRFFCADELAAAGFTQPIAQINHTLTCQRGAVRGLHFQCPPHAEGKLVSCLRGEIFDVAVDLRADSPTFLHWHAERLSAANCRSLMIPRGFAHGFQTLSDDCELIYLHSAPYVAAAESALNVRDTALAIDWPLAITDISDRDLKHPMLTGAFKGLDV